MDKPTIIFQHLHGTVLLLLVLAFSSCQMVTFPQTHPAIATDADAFAIGVQTESQVSQENVWMVFNAYGGETSGESAVESEGINFLGTGLALRKYFSSEHLDFWATTKLDPFLFAGAETLWVDGPSAGETEATWGHNSYWDTALLLGYGLRMKTLAAGSAIDLEISAGHRMPLWGRLDGHENFGDYDVSGPFVNLGISF